MFGTIRLEFSCFDRYSQSSHVRKEKNTVPVFKRIRPDCQCLVGNSTNSNLWKDTVRIIMFGKIGPEFQRLK